MGAPCFSNCAMFLQMHRGFIDAPVCFRMAPKILGARFSRYVDYVFAMFFLAIPGLQTQCGQGRLLQVATIITQQSQPYKAASRDEQPSNQILHRKLLKGQTNLKQTSSVLRLDMCRLGICRHPNSVLRAQ